MGTLVKSRGGERKNQGNRCDRQTRRASVSFFLRRNNLVTRSVFPLWPINGWNASPCEQLKTWKLCDFWWGILWILVTSCYYVRLRLSALSKRRLNFVSCPYLCWIWVLLVTPLFQLLRNSLQGNSPIAPRAVLPPIIARLRPQASCKEWKRFLAEVKMKEIETERKIISC